MATGLVQPFLPQQTVGVNASTTAAAATGLMASDAVLVFNSTAAVAFVQMGGGTATATSTPVPAGGRQLFAAGPYSTPPSVVLASGTGTVYFTAGSGTAY